MSSSEEALVLRERLKVAQERCEALQSTRFQFSLRAQDVEQRIRQLECLAQQALQRVEDTEVELRKTRLQLDQRRWAFGVLRAEKMSLERANFNLRRQLEGARASCCQMRGQLRYYESVFDQYAALIRKKNTRF